MRAVLIAVVLAGCQDNVKTPFPDGLEPFDDDITETLDLPAGESLTIVDTQNRKSTIEVYGRGLVMAAPGDVWATEQMPEVMWSRCQTTRQTVSYPDAPAYMLDFDVDYEVDDILNVSWKDRWRGDVVEGTVESPAIAMVKHQKVEGSDFIDISEGSIELLSTEDDGVSELRFVEHLNAVTADAGQVRDGMKENFDAIVAVVHGRAIPNCP